MAAKDGSLVDRALRGAMRRGLRRGIGDGSRAWLAVGTVALGIRLIQRMAGPGKPIVVTEELAPGQTLVIRHLAPEG
ncbi:MAG TPA: hypothetical protein VGI06_16010 [Acidimicrobiales bacterium]|jgi:hypothetical protein